MQPTRADTRWINENAHKWKPKPTVKIESAGQPCRKCGLPVTRQSHNGKRPSYKPGGYYFEYWFKCNRCKAIYLVESAKVYFDNVPMLEPVTQLAPWEEPEPVFDVDKPLPEPIVFDVDRVPVSIDPDDDWPPWETKESWKALRDGIDSELKF